MARARRAQRSPTAHLDEPPLDLTVKDDPEVWARRLDAEPLYGSTLRRAAGGAIEDLPGYGAGRLVGAGRRGRPARPAAAASSPGGP